MCEAVDNWLSVFHFIVLGDEWEVQQHDCCPFNELLFPFCFHYLPDIHHCFWLLWLPLFISMYEKKHSFVFERIWEDGRIKIHWQWNSLLLEWPIMMAWCVCVSGNHEQYHIAWNKMTFRKQNLWWSVLSVKDEKKTKNETMFLF